MYIFQVITGGNYDVDMELVGPDGRQIYKDIKKQYDSIPFTANVEGEYRFCFSNEFSTFSHKVVYFDFQVGEDQPLQGGGERATAMTQVCSMSECIDTVKGMNGKNIQRILCYLHLAIVTYRAMAEMQNM